MLYCFVFYKGSRRGKKITKALERLGPSFIKLGQTLSVRPDIVGEDIATELSNLRDNIPPFSYKKVKKTIEKEFQKPLEEIFLQFGETAVAAASIAQVHEAVTHEGEKVAVKILRPKIEKSFRQDLKLLYFIAHFVNGFASCKRLKPVEVVDFFRDAIKKELDLRMEAASASELKENCQKDEGFYVPEVFWELTTQRVLTTQWIDGIPINENANLLKAGHNLEDISKKFAISFFNQTYRDGFFHADVHPGNLFVNKNGDIVPVDFGIMGRLDKETRIYVAEILRGFIKGDYEHVARVHFEAGYVPKEKSMGDFSLACRAIGEPIMGLPVNQISIAKLLALLFKVTEDFEMETQPQLLLLQKTMVLVEGVGQELYPDVNMWTLAEPWIEKWAKQNMNPKAKLEESAKEAKYILQSFPSKLRKIDKIIDSYAKEGLKLHPDTIANLKKKKNECHPLQSFLLIAVLSYVVFRLVY